MQLNNNNKTSVYKYSRITTCRLGVLQSLAYLRGERLDQGVDLVTGPYWVLNELHGVDQGWAVGRGQL